MSSNAATNSIIMRSMSSSTTKNATATTIADVTAGIPHRKSGLLNRVVPPVMGPAWSGKKKIDATRFTASNRGDRIKRPSEHLIRRKTRQATHDSGSHFRRRCPRRCNDHRDAGGDTDDGPSPVAAGAATDGKPTSTGDSLGRSISVSSQWHSWSGTPGSCPTRRR